MVACLCPPGFGSRGRVCSSSTIPAGSAQPNTAADVPYEDLLWPATRCPGKHTSPGSLLAAPRALPLGVGVSVCLLSGTGEAQRDLIYNRTLKSGFSFIALQLKMGQIAAHKPIIEMKYNFFNIRFFLTFLSIREQKSWNSRHWTSAG